MTQPTIGDLIAKHNEIKAFIEAEDATYSERMKPYKQGLVAIAAACGDYLQEQGLQNFKADGAGTAYLQHGLSVKVDNREEFLQFVTKQNAWDFLDAGVLKDPVRAYREQHNEDPPGIRAEEFVKCLIRRT